MNELMKKFVRRATDEYGIGGPWVDQEEFVRLIMQEIVDVVNGEEDKVDMNWRCKDGLHITWKLKQHFGIES